MGALCARRGISLRGVEYRGDGGQWHAGWSVLPILQERDVVGSIQATNEKMNHKNTEHLFKNVL